MFIQKNKKLTFFKTVLFAMPLRYQMIDKKRAVRPDGVKCVQKDRIMSL